MFTPIAHIRVMDDGKYNRQFFQLSLKKEYDEEDELHEEILIKYGRFTEFMPCSVMFMNEKIYLSAAGVGIFADIKIPVEEWLKALKRLGSKERLESWEYCLEKVNKKEIAL